MRWRLDPKREDLKLQLVLNHRDEAPSKVSFENPLEASLFCLQNSSTASPKKQTGGDKGAPPLSVMERAVEPLVSHVSGVVLALCFLGNAFDQRGKNVTNSKEGKIARGLFIPSFL